MIAHPQFSLSKTTSNFCVADFKSISHILTNFGKIICIISDFTGNLSKNGSKFSNFSKFSNEDFWKTISNMGPNLTLSYRKRWNLQNKGSNFKIGRFLWILWIFFIFWDFRLKWRRKFPNACARGVKNPKYFFQKFFLVIYMVFKLFTNF